jgi:hypothetical protein
MTPIEDFVAGGFIILGVFTILFLMTGAVEFHQRGMERVRRAECDCENLDEDVEGYTCYKCYERES